MFLHCYVMGLCCPPPFVGLEIAATQEGDVLYGNSDHSLGAVGLKALWEVLRPALGAGT